jgi:hypothetical protein
MRVVTALNMTFTVFWAVTPYSFVDRPVDVSERPAAYHICSIYLILPAALGPRGLRNL